MLADALVLCNLLHLNMISARKLGQSITCLSLPFLVAILCGYQAVLFAIFTKTFAISEGLMPEDSRLTRFFHLLSLERGLIISAGAMLIGLALLLAAVHQWRLADFGSLSYSHTMRLVVPGVTLTALGFQTMLLSFFMSILGVHRQ